MDDAQVQTNTITTPAVPARPEDDRVAALAAKNAELLAEVKAAKERMRMFGTALGFDPTKQTPEELAQARSAAQREAERRASAIERAITRTLATSKPVPEPIFDLLLNGAITSPSIKVGDDGSVTGAREYLDSVIAAMRLEPSAAPRPDAPQVPRQKLPGPDDVEPQYQSVSTFAELLAMGTQHVTAYAEKYPQRYEQMRSAHFDALKTPSRHLPPQALGTR